MLRLGGNPCLRAALSQEEAATRQAKEAKALQAAEEAAKKKEKKKPKAKKRNSRRSSSSRRRGSRQGSKRSVSFVSLHALLEKGLFHSSLAATPVGNL